MQTKTISKSIQIQASRQKVWEVLVNDEYNEIWFSEFSADTKAESDWQAGSKITFSDGQGGIIGKIIVYEPFEALSIEYTGILSGNQEDYESDMAQSVKGSLEVYKLSDQDGLTVLETACDMSPDFFAQMEKAWERAIHKIKHIAEELSAINPS